MPLAHRTHSASRARVAARAATILALALAVPAAPALAQRPAARRDSVRLLTRRDLWPAAGFVGAAAVLVPLDQRIAERLQRPGAQQDRLLHHAATDAELLAIPGIYVLGAGAYVVGRLARAPGVAATAVETGEAVFTATVAAEVIKGIAGRARPYAVADSDSRDFAFGRGITKGEDYASLPSVHAATAFAAASVVTRETMLRWPRATWYVAPAAYGAATLVGVARLYHDQHWASDVVVGAAVGTFSALGVGRWNDRHPDNWIDRIFLATSVVPAAGHGARIAVSLPTR